MTSIFSTTILLLLAGALAPPTFGGSATVPEPAALHAVAATTDTVHVAPPTGETDSDRANVQTSFDAVQPGGTVLFSPGTYLLGAGARLTVPDVTVLGHPSGTVLRGCDPEAFAVDTSESLPLVFGCTGLYVQAERQTIRGLTFEYTWHGIVVGPFPASEEEAVALGERGESPPDYPAGGQRIEGNTFRATPNGLRVLGIGNELSVVRDNDFIDVFHAIGISGAPLRFLDNRVTVAVPGEVPFSGHTGSAIIVSPGQTDCAGHVVAGNRIDGYPDPIYVRVRRGETCRGVEIRDNTIHAARVKVPEAWGGYSPTDVDSTMVGTPITLMNRTAEPTPGVPEVDTEGVLEDILVHGNQIVGAEGLGILIQGVSRSRIAGNTIVGIERRDPFPGITWDGFEPRWEPANGSGIWVSPGSDENEIVDNTFEDVAAAAVFLEGDDNRVELRSADDSVRDLGSGNRVATEMVSDRDAEVSGEAAFESRFVEANGVRLQYMDFGGSGLPLIFVQDVHNYFEDENPYFRDLWSAFYARFTDRHRVLAQVRRGYGESDAPGWGYDVPTQSEDLLALMDALGIRRAVLVGRTTATQDMTWIAEHHSESVVGLVYMGNPPVFDSPGSPDAQRFSDLYSLASCDLQERASELLKPRSSWRPHFLADSSARIDVAALRFTNPAYDRKSMSVQRLDRLEAALDEIDTWEADCPGEEPYLAFVDSLASDPGRRLALREAFEASDNSIPVDDAMVRAFGVNMETIREPDDLDLAEYHDFVYPHIRKFLESLRSAEANGKPATLETSRLPL